MDEKNLNSPQPQPPVDLPVSGYFGQGGNSAKGPEDILESIEKEDVAVASPMKPMPAPMPRSAMPAMNIPPSVPPQEKPETKEPMFNRGKRALVIVVLGLVLVGVIGVSAWYGYGLFVKSFSQSADQVVPADNQAIVPEISGNNNTIPEVQVNQPAVETEPVVEKPADADKDGLTDEDEELYGTNPNEIDTDADGLTDRDEVKVFKTDPNNPDTDGDTYADGQEVRGGYDPKGPGKLLEVQ